MNRSVSITETSRVTLEKTRVFAGLPAAALSELRQGMDLKSFKKGQWLYREGDAADEMFIVRSGSISLRTNSPVSGVELETRGPGDLVGETAMMDDSPRITDAVCKTDCRVFVLSRQQLYRVIATYPAVAEHVLKLLGRRIRDADLRQIRIFRESAAELERRMSEQQRLASKGEMAAEISHDLRNLLGLLVGYVQLLEHDIALGNLPNATTHLQGIQNAHKQVQLYADSLLHSRHPSDRKDLLSLNDFIVRQISFFRAIDSLKGVTFRIKLDPAVPQLELDASGLQQVLYTLVVNSNEAMTAERVATPMIHVKTRYDDAKKRIKIIVRDNGPGFDPAVRDRLFKERVSGKCSGHGFGLMNAARVVAEHGGAITAKNRSGGGAKIIIVLPVQCERRSDTER